MPTGDQLDISRELVHISARLAVIELQMTRLTPLIIWCETYGAVALAEIIVNAGRRRRRGAIIRALRSVGVRGFDD